MRTSVRTTIARNPIRESTSSCSGVADALRINVWKNPELSTDARVRPDGTITMPLIGDMKAAGRTPRR